MAGAKKALPPPIDRPLSKAYLRKFTGWSTAYPPGLSEPTSCRIMENVVVMRNGGLGVRPGLRYLSYAQTPDMDREVTDVPGVAIAESPVGSLEPFYLNNGARALLFAVRETDQTVGFRVLLFTGVTSSVFRLTDPEIGFYIPQGEATLNFSRNTTHVKYLQIDNKIMALSDAGESMRLFMVGAEKVAKRLNEITQPEWVDSHKLTVLHPQADWINKLGTTSRRNELLNPSFEVGTWFWDKSDRCGWDTETTTTGVSEGRMLVVRSLPQRTNLQYAPLHDVENTGLVGWHSHKELGNPKLVEDGSFMKILDPSGKGLFMAYGAKVDGVEPGRKYKLAVDFVTSSAETTFRPRLSFYGTNGARIGDPYEFLSLDGAAGKVRFESPAVEAPPGSVTARVFLGGSSNRKVVSWVKVKNVVLCRGNEDSTMFTGDSGTGYFWTGAPNKSASVHHPATDITITSNQVPITPGVSAVSSMHVKGTAARQAVVRQRLYDKNKKFIEDSTGSVSLTSNWQRTVVVAGADPKAVVADMTVTIQGAARGERFYLDAGMIESNVSAVGAYFDGSTPGSSTVSNSWTNRNKPHQCASVQSVTQQPGSAPTAASAQSATTLISSEGVTKNTYKMGLFYTFENEVGESTASKITEIRMQRPQSNWLWETTKTPTGASEPSGTLTDNADLCADQLVAKVPPDVYANAVAAGAVRWNLYTFNWSDQDPVPVVGQLSGSRELYPDEFARQNGAALSYDKGGWINLTPARKLSLDDAMLPTKDNRVNYSRPPRARSGLVAADRTILVGDPTDLAAIHWSSNRPGEYLKFTASKGGGIKTLSAGNLHLPGTVALWQNPQSVDTLTILCLGSDGSSICYYMTPASVNAQSGSTSVMGFEETTNTPGTLAPYGVEVVNNALYRPIDRALLKSTAQNYNINHKTMTDDIANMWTGLHGKQWIMSTNLDNRLFYIVNNPRGEPIEDGCKGNEIWVYDLSGGENGTWSRLLIQASALRILEHGNRVYVGVVRPDGLYYLDSEARLDDYVKDDGTVGQRPIPWFFETNTQGANRAHDAWAHLQQVSISLGNFYGTMRYGVRGMTVNGVMADVSKQFEELTPLESNGQTWDVLDHLLVRRDLMEWYFYAGSVEGKPSSGELGFVQYRYTPVSVNVGYEYGSVETFEYGRNAVQGGDAYSANGIPRPAQDFNRP